MAASSPDADLLERAGRAVRTARRAVVLTGAGVSAASGVPTFRGEDGLWKEHRPEELATPAAFEDDPRLVWEWYGWRRRAVRDCAPNAAHLELARWTLRREGVRLVTQNVDDLHRQALRRVVTAGGRDAPGARAASGTGVDRGASSADGPDVPDRAVPVELHGSLFRTRCTECGRRRRDRGAVDASSRATLPRCDDCGGLLRPDVVWFGESLPRAALDEALAAARGAETCLVVGTSAAVQPAASVATVAADAGATLVEVNPERTPLTRRAEVSLRAGAEEAVPALLSPSSPGGDAS